MHTVHLAVTYLFFTVVKVLPVFVDFQGIVSHKKKILLLSESYSVNMSSRLDNRSMGIIVAEATTLIIINLTSFVGNVLVVLTMYKSRRLRTTSDIYIFALAVADLMWSTCVMPMTTLTLLTGKWNFSEAVCEFQASIDYLVLYSSPVTMGLAAFNRYMRIVKSNHYHKVFSLKKSRMFLAVSWLLLAMYIIIVRSTTWQRFEFSPDYALCSVIFSTKKSALIHYCITIPVCFVIPCFIIMFSYLHVYKAMRQHNRSVSPSFHNRTNQARLAIQEIRISRALFFVTAVFVVCWLPTWVIALVKRLRPTLKLHRSWKLVPVYLPFLGSAINPFIYAGNNPTFRFEFKRLFWSSWNCNFKRFIRLKPEAMELT